MRTIKFRGKGYNNEWYYGSLTIDKEGNPYIMQSADISINWFIDEASMFPVRPETVGQYTGLHYADGKEVYEGDIVSGDDELVAESILLQVKYGIIRREFSTKQRTNLYEIPCFYFENIRTKEKLFPCIDFPDQPHGMIYIGNAYDNPELIKGSV